MRFLLVELYTVMQLKKQLNFIKQLPQKLNRFYVKNSKSKLIIKNKSKNNIEFNPVTNFDKNFEKYIRLLINKSFAKDAIIGEEYQTKLSLNHFKWSIDPIDGTKSFVIGVPTWSNLIGLLFKENSLIGLANFPELKRYYLSDGKKSYLYKDKKKFVLQSLNNHQIKNIRIIGNFYGNFNRKKRDKIINKLGKSFRLISYDALNYCLIAEGKLDAVVETNLKPYDIIPLIPILRNSGAFVSTWSGGKAEKGGNILATSNINLHNKILKILKPFTKTN